jgi:hypothetical protein
MKKFIYIVLVGLVAVSCSDFLDRAPKDALSTSTYPKSEKDVEMLAIGCYNKWCPDDWTFEGDASTDNCYDGFPWEGWSVLQDGTMSASGTGRASGLYTSSYETIIRCNNFLQVAEPVEFSNPDRKKEVFAEVRFIRAYRYFLLTMGWGGVPMVTEPYNSIEESVKEKSSPDVIVKFINDELDEIAPMLPADPEKGRIGSAAAYALKMRLNLFKGEWQASIDAAREIEKLDYSLYTNGANAYQEMFLEENEDNKEVILAYQFIKSKQSGWLINQMPNGDGGWSSIVPTHNLVDAYETINGLTIDEDGDYDATHPYLNRDPRLKMTVLYSGRNWKNNAGVERVYNAVDKNLADGSANPDYRNNANNSTKSGYNLIKWGSDLTKFPDMWDTGFDIYVFRFAEVLLSKAEALIESNQMDKKEEIYNAIDEVRQRAGMPKVDRTKYSTQEKLRELIRRERRVEFAGEGLRRWDIIRWDIAKEVLNGDLYAVVGTVDDPTNPVEELRVSISGKEKIVTNKWAAKNAYFPFAQTHLDMNPKLVDDNY